ncbi:MAG: FAD-binding protein, partial [Gammaproteobacteria bacterium]|nr:FAD-binding protein [Gammaproteobacteria bacterium]
VPWRNWSGGGVANPAGRFAPSSEAELMEFLNSTSGPIRPVGSGHSFTPLVPTDGHIVVIDQLAGMLDHDPGTMRATFGAGSRLGDMGVVLEGAGQGMFNLPDIDRQTLAGATATATHGTGIGFTCLSGYVTNLRLVTPNGELIDVSADENRDLFDAARVSLGSLGVITRMTLQNRGSYRLKSKSWIQPIEDVLDGFDESAAKHRHFEMFPLTHSDYAITLAIDETTDPINNPPPSPEEDAAFGEAMRGWTEVPPRERLPLVNALAEQIAPSEAVDVSYKILSNIRNNRFNEMEYSVPIEAGAECLREVLHLIIEKEVDVVFPLEYRYVSRDDTWLGMSSGDEDHAAISIHRTAEEDYRPYFELIEPIFWKYGGRPHWGKVHSLGAEQLSRLYPRFRDFQEIREGLDPTGRMLNEHLRNLFLS